MPGSFVDSNVIIYLVSANELKASRAEAVVRAGGVISVQVLNEVANVARRKLGFSWSETHDLLNLARRLLSVRPVTLEMHEVGLALAERHRLPVYDALIVAAALEADCEVLLSEDMQHGRRFESRLEVVNPFPRSP